MYTIKNANVLNENFMFEKTDIAVEDKKIVKIAPKLFLGDIIEADEAYVLPGLVNIHTHGAMGHDATGCNYKGINAMSKYWAKTGTTSFLPTVMTAPENVLCSAMEKLNKAIERGVDGASVIGINMEGPYLSEKYKGAHRPDWLCSPNELDFDKVQQAAQGNIRLVTIAPEIDGSDEFIKKYAGKVCISLGHSNADYDTCMSAFENGAGQVTHLFNAMPSVHHRDLHLIEAAYECGAMVELIGDGLHVKSTTAMMAYKLFGADRMILINDSVNAAGLGEGTYDFGGYEVTVKDGVARQADGTICGGTASLWDCVKNMVSWGVRLEEAVKMASYNPARQVGLLDSIGSIKEGKDADFIIATKELEIKDVFIKGRKI